MAKTLTLVQTGLYVVGKAQLLLWSGGRVWVNMAPFHVVSSDEIPGKVNDGGYGCLRILMAQCDVYEDYEGTHVYLEGRSYGEEDLANAKRGV